MPISAKYYSPVNAVQPLRQTLFLAGPLDVVVSSYMLPFCVCTKVLSFGKIVSSPQT